MRPSVDIWLSASQLGFHGSCLTQLHLQLRNLGQSHNFNQLPSAAELPALQQV